MTPVIVLLVTHWITGGYALPQGVEPVNRNLLPCGEAYYYADKVSSSPPSECFHESSLILRNSILATMATFSAPPSMASLRCAVVRTAISPLCTLARARS